MLSALPCWSNGPHRPSCNLKQFIADSPGTVVPLSRSWRQFMVGLTPSYNLFLRENWGDQTLIRYMCSVPFPQPKFRGSKECPPDSSDKSVDIFIYVFNYPNIEQDLLGQRGTGLPKSFDCFQFVCLYFVSFFKLLSFFFCLPNL